MKIIFRSAFMAAMLIAASCGKDSADDTAQQQQQEAEQLEKTPLEANTVSDNLLISGGTKMEGMPPAPTGTLSFDASDSSKSAFLGEGFDVTMSSDSPLVGAYIQIKGEDGTSADSYYDVNIDANAADNKSSKKIGKRNPKSAFAKKENDISLDIDFTAEIEPGEFCYEICVYDVEGNISEPQEVCITVESWGGNSAAVGAWVMVREEETDENGGTVTYLLGVQSCDEVDTFTCDNGGTLETSRNCITINDESLTINADGTYTYVYDEDYKYLKSDDSEANCEAMFEDDSYVYISKGKWAYTSDDGKLVFLEFEYSTEDYVGIQEDVHEPGEADTVFEDGAIMNGNSLIGHQGDFKIFFEK